MTRSHAVSEEVTGLLRAWREHAHVLGLAGTTIRRALVDRLAAGSAAAAAQDT